MAGKIAFFDFDGTITSKDSFIDFILFVRGRVAFIAGMLLLSPAMALFLSGIISNAAFKMLVLRLFFGGTTAEVFEGYGRSYSERRLSRLIRPKALERIAWHRAQGHTVVIVSASPKEWIENWARQNGCLLIATELERKDGRISGIIDNCFGPRKVDRIKAVFDLTAYNYVYTYGDSYGDKEMLALGHERYYRPFTDREERR